MDFLHCRNVSGSCDCEHCETTYLRLREVVFVTVRTVRMFCKGNTTTIYVSPTNPTLRIGTPALLDDEPCEFVLDFDRWSDLFGFTKELSRQVWAIAERFKQPP